jgi:hypothetical protein
MLIRLFSDLHLEFIENRFDIEQLDTDQETCLILAGDIHVGKLACLRIEEWAKRFKYVVYISGNHEYYNGVVQLVDDQIEYALGDIPNVHYLCSSTYSYVEIEDYVIWGNTFWTSLEDPREPNLDYFVKRGMNDFIIIRRLDMDSGNIVQFDPDCCRRYHKQAFNDLTGVLDKFSDKNIIVVTHHAPSEESSLPIYLGSKLQHAYYTPLEGYILSHPNIKYWFHGHMHNSSDYMIGNTRVITNPYGYAGYEVNPNFNPTLLIKA